MRRVLYAVAWFCSVQSQCLHYNATCPRGSPCCNEYGWCGSGADFCGECGASGKLRAVDGVGGGCQIVNSIQGACYRKPCCENFTTTTFPSPYLLVDQGQIEMEDGELHLPLVRQSENAGIGARVSSKLYAESATVSVSMMMGAGAGVVSSFVLMSDEFNELDFEWVGRDTCSFQSNYYIRGWQKCGSLILQVRDWMSWWRGIPDYTRVVTHNFDHDLSQAFHNYTIQYNFINTLIASFRMTPDVIKFDIRTRLIAVVGFLTRCCCVRFCAIKRVKMDSREVRRESCWACGTDHRELRAYESTFTVIMVHLPVDTSMGWYHRLGVKCWVSCCGIQRTHGLF